MYGGERRDRCVGVCVLHKEEKGAVFVLSVGEGVEQDSVSDV